MFLILWILIQGLVVLENSRLYVEALVLKEVLRLKVCWELSLIDVRIPKSTLLGAWGYCGGF
jgi:hypothetical protein